MLTPITDLATTAESLALGGLTWLRGAGRETDAGLEWPPTPADEDVDPTLYLGARESP